MSLGDISILFKDLMNIVSSVMFAQLYEWHTWRCERGPLSTRQSSFTVKTGRKKEQIDNS